MRHRETGEVIANAHVIGFFRRICKLLFYGIRPVFVFDGETPQIKIREIKLRRKRRGGMGFGLENSEDGDGYKRVARKILAAKLKALKSEGKKSGRNKNDLFYDGEGYDKVNMDKGKTEEKLEKVMFNYTNKPSNLSDKSSPMHKPATQESDESSVEWEGSENGQSDSSIHLQSECDETEIDINYVVSLPSSMQKEVIEKAKRNQRLKSRREFMPVAAKPG